MPKLEEEYKGSYEEKQKEAIEKEMSLAPKIESLSAPKMEFSSPMKVESSAAKEYKLQEYVMKESKAKEVKDPKGEPSAIVY